MTGTSVDPKKSAQNSTRRDRMRRWRDPFLAPLTKLVELVLGSLSWRSAQAMGRILGELAWRVSKRDRIRALAHLAIAFPDLSLAQRTRLARQSARHHGMNFTECMHLLHQDPKTAISHLKVEGQEHLEGVRDRSTLVITGHCGNWEFMSVAFAHLGLPMAAVVRAMDEAWADDIATRLREHFGTRIVRRGRPETVRGLLQVLRHPTFLAMVIDQDFKTQAGVWVPFFGKLAHTPAGPTDFALRQSLPVIPAFSQRLADGSHLLRFHAAIDLPADRVEATAMMAAAVEQQIRRCPEQWVWAHRRWRRRPPGGRRRVVRTNSPPSRPSPPPPLSPYFEIRGTSAAAPTPSK